jgi:hypothetical protein
MTLQEGDTVIGPRFGTRYKVLRREATDGHDDVRIRERGRPVERWTVQGLELLGYRKETSA